MYIMFVLGCVSLLLSKLFSPNHGKHVGETVWIVKKTRENKKGKKEKQHVFGDVTARSRRDIAEKK